MAAAITLSRTSASEALSGVSPLGLDGLSASAGMAVPFEDGRSDGLITGVVIGLLLTLAAAGIIGFCVTLAGV